MASTYNFTNSLERIDLRISDIKSKEYLPVIPSYADCGTRGTYYAYGTVVCVWFGLLDGLSSLPESTSTNAIECFVSETCEILRSNQSCRDVIVADSYITAVYNTSMKTEINEVLDDMARIRSIAMVICKKIGLESKHLNVKIAACYDKLIMSVVEARASYKQYLWRGNAITKAKDMVENVDDGTILISKVVWNNLTDSNQKLFKLANIFEEVYEGHIVNIAMNNWLDTE